MTFSDKLIALRKKAGWSQEELAERLNVSRQSVSKWESAQSMPDIDKILQLSSLFSVTTDCLLKDTQDDTQPAAAQTPSPLPRVTLAQADDYLTKAQANAPQKALATPRQPHSAAGAGYGEGARAAWFGRQSGGRLGDDRAAGAGGCGRCAVYAVRRGGAGI